MAKSRFFTDEEVSRLGAAGGVDFSLGIGPANFAIPAVQLLDELIMDLSVLQPEQDVSGKVHERTVEALDGLSHFLKTFIFSGPDTAASRLSSLFDEAFHQRYGLSESIHFLEQLATAEEILLKIKADHASSYGRPVESWLEIACAFILRLHTKIGGSPKLPYDKAPLQKALTYSNFAFVSHLTELILSALDRIASTEPFAPPLPPPDNLQLLARSIQLKKLSVKPLRSLLEKAYIRVPELRGSYMLSGGRMFNLGDLPYPADEEGEWPPRDDTPIK